MGGAAGAGLDRLRPLGAAAEEVNNPCAGVGRRCSATRPCCAGTRCLDGRCRCQRGLTECEGSCRDLRADPANCGACGKTCVGTRTCCEGRCVDVQTNRRHCGACGNACPADRVCQFGVCRCVGTNECTGVCCTPGEICDGERCVCPSDRTVCGGACVVLRVDEQHCGTCGNACPQPTAPGLAAVCSGGRCGQFCVGAGSSNEITFCGQDVGCTDLAADPNNCGRCGNVCASGECQGGVCGCAAGTTTCGDGVCADLESDPAHCGACGATCRIDQVCEGGQCTCAGGLPECGGTCCPGSSTCIAGACCPLGQECGAGCCAAGATCQDGQCVAGGLQPGARCDPSRPGECSSGICGCAPAGCVCRRPDCAPPGGSCAGRGSLGCCRGVCQAGSQVCVG